MIFSISNSGGGGNDYNYAFDETDVYVISNYVVDVEVTDKRLAHITETIDVDFYKARAAIIRNIPVSGGIEIRDITVKDRVFSVEKYDNFLLVDLEADNFQSSLNSRRYVISYILDYSKAFNHNFKAPNTIPLNVIGTGWTVQILNAEINLTLPDTPLDSYYYVGREGEKGGRNRLNVLSNENSVTITTKDTLNPYEGITVGYDMPEGTMKSYIDPYLVIKILGVAAYIVIVYLIFSFFGKERDITPVMNFKAPEGMNPATVGYLIDSNISTQDMTSLIYYWASDKHLIIKDMNDGKNIELVKISDLDDSHKDYEHKMFNELFNKGNSVKINSLKEKYYLTLNSARNMLKRDYAGLLYETRNLIICVAVLLVNIIAVTVYALYASMAVSKVYMNFGGLLTALIASLVIMAGATALIRYEPKILEKKNKYYMLYFSVVTLAAMIMFFVLKGRFLPFTDNVLLTIGFAVSLAITPFIQLRSDYYNDKLNQLIGFKNFILNAEKDRLELLLKDNPEYYYDILPYANVLGVSDIWMNKFKSLALEPPSWYYTNRPFRFYVFYNSFRRSVNSISTALSSTPAPKGSGGKGFGGGGGFGGGFSGGGFGGGGGFSR
ncbi:MAG: DUF2207 family protein [Christensenellales bacterium]